MNLGFLILADHSEALNGKVYMMGGGWNVLRFPQLPHDWGFALAFGLDVPWNETEQAYEATMHLEDPDGGLLGDEFTMGFEAERPPEVPPGADQRIVLSLRTQGTFENEGPHAVVVKVDGEEIGRTRFYVVQAPPEMPEMPPGLTPEG